MIGVFPGQGSQRVGMARELYESSSEAKRTLDAAESALPGLMRLMWEGPEEELRLTANQQPALVAAGAAAYAAYLEAGGTALSYAAGHSLGEYTALVAAGALGLEDAVRLVRARGEYMQEAVPAGVGAMAAILKVDSETVESVLEETRGVGVVEVANYNAPGQTVISGAAAAVEAASARLKESGARAIPLKVSAPFHCSLMQPAAERLAVDLAAVRFEEPRFPVVNNVTATPMAAPAAAAELLTAQVTGSVRWVETVRWLHGATDGQAAFLEFGSGDVLTNLIKRTVEGAVAASVADPEGIEEVLAL
ncbi:MAG TPA: ACP S-malonyltransferase [Trueperaceae bacterium]|nr:ACP S-malonyltransferase [Trueperaceae bacterium]